jgi:Transposase IS66 family/IS66 C-terminal element
VADDDYFKLMGFKPTLRQQMRHDPAQVPPPSSALPDHPSYDLKAHLAYVQALWKRYPLNTDEKCEAHLLDLHTRIWKGERIPWMIWSAINKTIKTVLNDDDIFRTFPITLEERNYLTRMQARFSTTVYIEAADKAFIDFFRNLNTILPECAFEEARDISDEICLVLSDVLPNLKYFPNGVYHAFASPEISGQYVFPNTHRKLWENVISASGHDPETYDGSKKLIPAHEHLHYAPTRGGEHPQKHLSRYSGIMQADAYSGYNGLYAAGRKPGMITEAACWAHGRRKFFELAELQKAPVAIEAVRRIDELFAIEREINGQLPDRRRAVRQERSKPLVDELETWLREERRKLSSKSPVAKAIDYSLKRWPAFTRFLDNGRICLSNNAAERAVRGIAVGRRNWTFCGSDSGGRRAAAIYTLIETCKLNEVDARAWLADVLARIADYPARRITDLMPWNWKAAKAEAPAT